MTTADGVPETNAAAVLAEREAWAPLQRAGLGDPRSEQKRQGLLEAAERGRSLAEGRLGRPAAAPNEGDDESLVMGINPTHLDVAICGAWTGGGRLLGLSSAR